MVFSSVDCNTPPQTITGTGNSGTVIMETDTVSYHELMRLLEFGMIAPYRTNNTAPRNEEYTTNDPFVSFHNIITCTLLPVKDTLCSFRYDIVRIHHRTVLLWIIRIMCACMCVDRASITTHHCNTVDRIHYGRFESSATDDEGTIIRYIRVIPCSSDIE